MASLSSRISVNSFLSLILFHLFVKIINYTQGGVAYCAEAPLFVLRVTLIIIIEALAVETTVSRLKKMSGWRSMFNCSPSGFCARLTQTLQEDDADLWHDLTLHEIPPPPPIPRVVQLTPSPVSSRGNRRRNEEVESLIGLRYLDDEWADGAMPKNWHEEPCLELEETVIGDIFAATKRQAKHEPPSTYIRHHETDSRRSYDNDSFDGSSYSSIGKGSLSFLELKPRKLFPRTSPPAKVKSQGTSTTVTETTVSI